MKKIAALILCIIVMEVGCMEQEDMIKENGNRALEYVSEKYETEFKLITYEMADYLSNTDTVHCYVEGMNVENEHVEIYIIREGANVEYRDNYFSILVRPEMERYIGDMIGKQFSEYKIYRENEYHSMPSELNSDSTLEDLYQVDEKYWMNVNVYIKAEPDMTEEDYAVKMQSIEKELIESKHRYTIHIVALGEVAYESIERYNQSDFWMFYAENREPDRNYYYYVYEKQFADGEVLD